MKIAVYGNNYQTSHLDEMRGFLAWLRDENATLLFHKNFARYLIDNGFQISEAEQTQLLPPDVDFVLSIGGDGTFLNTADWVGHLEIPILGINTGHLGYLTGFSFANQTAIKAAIFGEYEMSSRMTLSLRSEFLPEGFSPFALNEISISKGDTTSMVEIRTCIDGRYLADYLADGLIISTPTGSTAYNLSCGGPILEPTLDSFVLSPIAPHSLTFRPLVVGSNSELLLEVRSRGAECHIGVDGRTFSVPSDGSKLRISMAPYRVNVVQPKGSDFPSVLRNKLGWGIRN